MKDFYLGEFHWNIIKLQRDYFGKSKKFSGLNENSHCDGFKCAFFENRGLNSRELLVRYMCRNYKLLLTDLRTTTRKLAAFCNDVYLRFRDFMTLSNLLTPRTSKTSLSLQGRNTDNLKITLWNHRSTRWLVRVLFMFKLAVYAALPVITFPSMDIRFQFHMIDNSEIWQLPACHSRQACVRRLWWLRWLCDSRFTLSTKLTYLLIIHYWIVDSLS